MKIIHSKEQRYIFWRKPELIKQVYLTWSFSLSKSIFSKKARNRAGQVQSSEFYTINLSRILSSTENTNLEQILKETKNCMIRKLKCEVNLALQKGTNGNPRSVVSIEQSEATQ